MKKRITKKQLQLSFKKTGSDISKLLKDLKKTKDKISRNKKLSEREKKSLVSEFEAEAKEKISLFSGNYNKIRKRFKSLDYEGFNYSSTNFTTNTLQETYRAKRGYSKKDLDKIVPSVLDEPNVTGVLVVFRVESEETGQRQYVSNYITKDLLERIQQNGQSVFEYVAERLRAGNTKDYNLKFIYLRIIYEKPKNSKSKNESRKNKV